MFIKLCNYNQILFITSLIILMNINSLIISILVKYNRSVASKEKTT